MTRPIIEARKDGKTNAFYAGRTYVRTLEYGSASKYRWHREFLDDAGRRLERAPFEVHQKLEREFEFGDVVQEIPRFLRRKLPDRIGNLADIPSLRELRDTEVTWLVDGLIPRGSVVMVTAPPAGYKTWLALAIAGAVSTGTDFLDRKTIQTTVVYLDRENPAAVIRQRLEMLKLDDSSYLKIWGRWVPDSPPLLGDYRLLEFARKYKPLIVVDSLVRFHESEENSASMMGRISECLKRLVDAGATVLLLHHQGKNPNMLYRGSSDILAGVDTAFNIIKEQDEEFGTILRLNSYKDRYAEESNIVLRPNFAENRFELTDDPADAKLAAIVEKIQYVIRETPGISQKDLLEKAKLPEENGRKILLQGNGKHWQASRGKGKTLHYYLKPTSPQATKPRESSVSAA
jgi:AAA domain